MRDFHFPGRSAAFAAEAMIATSQPFATAVGIGVLREGGTAADAAVAAAAVLAVVEPQLTGIGGDGFFMVARPGARPVAYNGSSRAPDAARLEWYADQGIDAIGPTDVHAVGVPGLVDVWSRLAADYGRKDLGSLLAPAIDYADSGYPVQPRVAEDWASQAEKLRLYPGTSDIFLPGGRAPAAGTVHRQPALAETLRRIAREGRDAFYRGDLAATMADTLRRQGGVHAAADFESFAGTYVEPIATDYRGIDVFQCPPNTQGLVALQILNILEGYSLSDLPPYGTERFWLELAAARLAFRDRNAYLADPDYGDMPLDRLLSKAYSAELRAEIDAPRAGVASHPARRANTVYVCAVDRDGMAVSLINSLSLFFGSGIVCKKTGVLFNNRLASFDLKPNHPNAIAPGKRPRHTTVPALAYRGDDCVMAFGVTGGDYQPVGQAHLLSNMVDFGMDPQEALDGPRAMINGDVVEVERSVPAPTVDGLRDLGFETKVPITPLGAGQIICIDRAAGVLVGGSDPRRDGCVLGC